MSLTQMRISQGLTDKNIFKSRAPDRGIKAYTYN